MVGTFTHFDTLFPAETIFPSSKPWHFKSVASAPGEISYFHAGSRYKLTDYLSHLPITGLLIAKEDQILFEGYQYARTDHDLFTSQSLAKTIVAMLAGIAMSDHSLNAITDIPSKYVPELKNTAYGTITLRDLLHMSSGVTCESKRTGPKTLLSNLSFKLADKPFHQARASVTQRLIPKSWASSSAALRTNPWRNTFRKKSGLRSEPKPGLIGPSILPRETCPTAASTPRCAIMHVSLDC